MTLTVTPSGALSQIVTSRWGQPDKSAFGEHAFGASLHDEASFNRFVLPRKVTAGWFYGTARWDDGQFIRYTIDDVRYF